MPAIKKPAVKTLLFMAKAKSPKGIATAPRLIMSTLRLIKKPE
jgi:hypothetical protein